VTHSIAASDSHSNKSRPCTRLSIVQRTVYTTWPPSGRRVWTDHAWICNTRLPGFFYLVLIHLSPGGTDVIEMLNLTTYIAFESEIIYRGVTTENVFYCHIALRGVGLIQKAL
jgi:hypothetical protein